MKQSIKTSKVVAISLFTFCTMAFAHPTFAHIKIDNPVELKFIGKIKDQPVFQLNLNYKETEVYYINIKDENYNVLYSEKIKGANLSRKYRLDIDPSELNSVGFIVRVEVTSAKTHKSEVYKMSSHTSVTTDIVVAKL